jgi:signal peptidase I
LEEAITLAKKKDDTKAGSDTDAPETEEKTEDVLIAEEKAEEPAEVVADEKVDEKVDEKAEVAAEEAVVSEAEAAEDLKAVAEDEASETVEADAVSEKCNEYTEESVAEEKAFQSPIEQIISRISKAEKESIEKQADSEVAVEEAVTEAVSDVKDEEKAPEASVRKSPFGILELISTLKNTDDSDTFAEESAEEAVEETDDAFEESVDEAETVEEEAPACEGGERVKASSKIFGDLLACFEGKKIPDELLASDDIIIEKEEETVEDTESAEDISSDSAVDDYTEDTEAVAEDTEADGGDVGFIPFEHEAPDEKDELFSEIFSEERSERRNKEKDRKKWQKQAGESNSFVLAIFDWLEVVVLSAAFALILFTFVMRMAVVDGNSMNHTLHDKEVLIISDLMYTPDNGDIIVFSSPNYPEPIVKRVIATEGQVVDIDFETWTVTVDGKKVSEEYVNRVPGSMNRSDMEFPLTVPEGKVFVMGDNRNDSLDSRNSRIGFVDERYILGEVKIRLFPIDRFGTVD